MPKSLTEMTAEIIAAQLAHRDMSTEQIRDALRNTFGVLTQLRDTESMKHAQQAPMQHAPTGAGEERGSISHIPGKGAYVPGSPGDEPGWGLRSRTTASGDPAGEDRAGGVVEGSGEDHRSEREEEQQSAPAVDPSQSILEDKIICLECGQEFKQLSHTHLRSHDLTPKDYRKKYGFPSGRALTAGRLSAARSRKAKEIGLAERSREARKARAGA